MIKTKQMNTTTQTPVQILQELIAIHTTRIELTEKLAGPDTQSGITGRLAHIRQQSELFTKELMSELSQFGDSIPGSVDNDNPYQQKYREVLGSLDGSANRAGTLEELETILVSTYKDYLSKTTMEAETIQLLIQKQAAAIQNNR